MELRLFNTMTREKEVFIPLSPKEVSFYTCGPTVYDYVHIGNLRTFLFEDVLRRVLVANGFKVKHVMNITDVGHLVGDGDEGEDKLEKGAAREGKTVWDVAAFYTEAFLANVHDLNILPPSVMPRATEYIPQQIALIQVLEKKGFTYTISDGVYFDTARLPDYGKLARLDIAGLQEGARVEKNAEKKNATDFALWKFSPSGPGAEKRAMEWESPWGVGFPGWHIECSAMAMELLGETIDIHASAIDHIPVHHTNEIAQSEAATGKLFARVWMHGEFLLVNEGRMGKSVGNFIRLEDVVARGFAPLAYRYFVLGAQYRSKLNFSWEAMQSAQNSYDKLIATVAAWGFQVADKQPIQHYKDEFMKAMNDDLNTSAALAVMWEMLKSDYAVSKKSRTLFFMDEILGLDIHKQALLLSQQRTQAQKDIPDGVRALAQQRHEAKQHKDYARADELRAQITERGYEVEDTPEGPMLKPIDRA